MEAKIKMVQGFPTPFGQGYVINANTPEERREEINNFYKEDWIPELLELNNTLELINPDYTIVQLKIKFGELTLYTEGINKYGQAHIDVLTNKLWFRDHPKALKFND